MQANIDAYSVLFTTKITQKQNKGWIDGNGIFFKSTDSIYCKIYDENNKFVTEGNVPSDHIPIQNGDEFVVRGYLIQIVERSSSNVMDDTNITEKTTKNDFVHSGQRFKPPKKITPKYQRTIVNENSDDSDEISQRYTGRKVNPRLEKYRIYKQSNVNEIDRNDNNNKIKRGTVQATNEIEDKRKPRSYEEILDFFMPDNVNDTDDKSKKLTKDGSKRVKDKDVIVNDKSTDQTESNKNREEVMNNVDDVSKKAHKSDIPSDDPESSKVYTVMENGDLVLPILWNAKSIGYPPVIQVSFQSIDEYKEAFINSLVYEMNARIKEVYQMYVAAKFNAGTVAPTCSNKEHGKLKFNVDKSGCYYYYCSNPKCKEYIKVPLEAEARTKNVKISNIVPFLRLKNIDAHECTYQYKSNQITVTFMDNHEDKELAKDDVWVIISSSVHFFVSANRYGASSNNKIYVTPFFNDISKIPNTLKGLAIRIMNSQSEKSSVNRLFYTNHLPIYPALLNGGKSDCVFTGPESIDQIANEFIELYKLNEDQKNCLLKVKGFFENSEPVILIHGVFGAGKSMMLAVIALFLDRVLSELENPAKILISAATNVAVDNVLENIIDFGFSNKITRVGSIKKIRRCILPFVTGHGDDASLNDLNSLKNDKDSNVMVALKNALGERETKATRIDKTRIVGVTLAATTFDVMQDRTFDFVLLDECSQQPEPGSFLALSFNCSRLICCGDPLQLPPTVAKESPSGYGRPIFTRISTFFEPVMLSIQYRCHPSIASICSRLFYDGKIKSGVKEEDRMPVHESIPTISFFDVSCGQEFSSNGSISNTQEATVVSHIVKYILGLGIDNKNIGIISFYKLQCRKICELCGFDCKHSDVDISTVDAFQGDERDIIIINTSRTIRTNFVDLPERINVAISRAKKHLIVVSNYKAFCNSKIWGYVFQVAKNTPNKYFVVESNPEKDWVPFS